MNFKKENSGKMDFIKIQNFCIYQRTPKGKKASRRLGENICKT